jgi:hypothetical protein
VSLEPCCGRGERLADNTTCGALCVIFPNCLPPPLPKLVAEVRRLRIEAQHDADGARDTTESLNLLHQALVAGLEGKYGRGD